MSVKKASAPNEFHGEGWIVLVRGVPYGSIRATRVEARRTVSALTGDAFRPGLPPRAVTVGRIFYRVVRK